ncbi:MAG TPA: hypothetical protein VF594_11145 [Rubricoccaceae bacterium]|jgi:hypothetical protein
MSFSTRFSALALAGLVAVGASGCDSGTEAPAAGPVVQFGATSTLAIEGTTVSIPVTLTGANGTPVTVEVLYAAGTSTATPDADFTGFGTLEGGLRRATVTFSGAADETQTVTFDAAADGIIETAETAVFALQRVSGASIGTRREFTANIGVPPISSVRAGVLASTATTEGVVTRAFGRNVWIQDNTGGTVLFGPTGSPIALAVASGAVRPGDRIQATGRLVEFQASAGLPGTGLFELDNILAGAFQVLARDQAPPAVQTVTLAQINGSSDDRYESEIVRVTGLTIDPAGDVVFVAAKNYTVSQTVGGTTTTAILRIGSTGDTALIGTSIPTGPFTFTGPIGQFRGTYQLTPVVLTDLVPE